ncbi:MAG: DUF7344 domain-containing protein [Haloferacaceae archaeon]
MTTTTQTDTILDLLANSRRRAILRYVSETDGPEPIEQVVESLTGPASASKADGTRRELAIEARHHHLPKLEETGVIEYDPRRGTIDRGIHFEEVVSLLGVLSAHRDDICPGGP